MSDVDTIISHLTSSSEADKKLVTSAYEFAKKAHKGHMRYSGKPYLSHLVAVASMLAEMGIGTRTVAAGLLHDTVEDTDVTSSDVLENFGEEIFFLVDGVTKLGSVRYYGSDRHNESLRKLFVATSQDIRVLIIKLIDRLHNMQTLQFVPKEKQTRIAQETLEIYVPVAHRLGMGRIRKELEDLAFPYVYPKEYERVKEVAKPFSKHAESTLEKARKTVQKKLAESDVRDFHTYTRIKGDYSLFKKLQKRDWDMDKIYDYLAIRVVVKNVDQCYQVLGVIHELWRPMPSRVKDYIAFPKPNGYRSIHTTVHVPQGKVLEIQIRTEEMHREAEFGIASHMIYKQKQQGIKESRANNKSWFASLIPSLFRPFSWRNNIDTTPPDKGVLKDRPDKEKIPKWIQEIAEAHAHSTKGSSDFIAGLRNDFFSLRIFVFTPDGDVVDLPVGATPIDFAYAIHSEVGNHTSGAKVNNKFVGLDNALHNGDVVEIIKKDSSYPTQKWLNMAKTSLAHRRIRAALYNNDGATVKSS